MSLALKRNIILAYSFAKRELKEKYIGTGLGQLWYILSPVITIFIYTVIFSNFMKMKLNLVESTYAYSIYIIPGLLAWQSFSKVLTSVADAIGKKKHLIKKMNVPIYVFFISIIMTEFMLFMLSMGLGVIFLLIVNHPVSISMLWIVPIMAIQTLFVFSLGVVVSLFMPFIKDLKEAIPVVIQLWFWMTPIIYVKEMIADKYPLILIYNPFYHFVHLYQDIFLYAKPPSLNEILIITSLALIGLAIAAYLYKKMVNTIRDVI